MKSFPERLKVRMQKNRPMTTISIRMPEDLIEELKEFAPLLGFAGYQSLIRSYIGEGIRRDEALFSRPEIKLMSDTLRKHGVAEEAIAEVIAETMRQSA